MAATKGERECFVYAVMDGDTPIYIGKGTGRRHLTSARRLGGEPRILERFTCEDRAFEREAELIAEMTPCENRNRGGGGGRCRPKKLTRAEFAARREHARFVKDLEAVGRRRYVARFLVERLDERNIAEFGVSKLDLNRLREVANGPRC